MSCRQESHAAFQRKLLIFGSPRAGRWCLASTYMGSVSVKSWHPTPSLSRVFLSLANGTRHGRQQSEFVASLNAQHLRLLPREQDFVMDISA
jgi:hypothetical protein